MREKVRIGVIADDITGANDIGVMLAKNGYRATVISLEDGPRAEDFDGADALIVNTGSRLDRPDTAAEKAARTAKLLLSLDCLRLHSKTCSVFRGNIGAFFDAVQDAAGIACSMVVLGFPRNGRTTLHGIHYVRGVPLEESAFSRDPVNPMRLSRLSDIIAQQSSRPCAEFPYEWLDEPEEEQQRHLTELKARARYVIFDVRDQQDLYTVARLIRDERNICGASAICEALPAAWGCRGPETRLDGADVPPGGVLIVSGSLTPQTLAQTDALRDRGIPAAMVDGAALLPNGDAEDVIEGAARRVCSVIEKGGTVLLCADQDAQRVRLAAESQGVTPIEAGRRITRALANALKLAQASRNSTAKSVLSWSARAISVYTATIYTMARSRSSAWGLDGVTRISRSAWAKARSAMTSARRASSEGL